LDYLWFLLTYLNNFSPPQSEMIGAHIWSKIYHLSPSQHCGSTTKCEQGECSIYFLKNRKMSLWYSIDFGLFWRLLVHLSWDDITLILNMGHSSAAAVSSEDQG